MEIWKCCIFHYIWIKCSLMYDIWCKTELQEKGCWILSVKKCTSKYESPEIFLTLLWLMSFSPYCISNIWHTQHDMAKKKTSEVPKYILKTSLLNTMLQTFYLFLWAPLSLPPPCPWTIIIIIFTTDPCSAYLQPVFTQGPNSGFQRAELKV